MICRRTFVAGAVVGCLADAAQAADHLPPYLTTLRPLPIRLRNGSSSTIGQQLTLGRAAVVSFWSTSYALCQSEARYLGRLRAETPNDDLDILGINIDAQRTEINVNWFIELTGAHYLHVYGDISTYQAFAGARSLRLPCLYVFGRFGEPIAEVRGYQRYQISRAVRAAIGSR